MPKSPTQEKLEAQRQRDIREVVVDSLLRYRCRRNMVMFVSVDLGISYTTLYRWCEDLSIDIDEYRRPVAKRVAQEAGERVLTEEEG